MTPQLCRSSEHGAKYQSQGSTSGHSHKAPPRSHLFRPARLKIGQLTDISPSRLLILRVRVPVAAR
jgi:hypothetical protein